MLLALRIQRDVRRRWVGNQSDRLHLFLRPLVEVNLQARIWLRRNRVLNEAVSGRIVHDERELDQTLLALREQFNELRELRVCLHCLQALDRLVNHALDGRDRVALRLKPGEARIQKFSKTARCFGSMESVIRLEDAARQKVAAQLSRVELQKYESSEKKVLTSFIDGCGVKL